MRRTTRSCHLCGGLLLCEEHYLQPQGQKGCTAASVPCAICWPDSEKPIIEWDEIIASVDLPADRTATNKVRPS